MAWFSRAERAQALPEELRGRFVERKRAFVRQRQASTVVSRALFLVGHCGVRPGEILILAFNRKAVEDVKARLEHCLPSPPLPHVMTFHALAGRLGEAGRDAALR